MTSLQGRNRNAPDARAAAWSAVRAAGGRRSDKLTRFHHLALGAGAGGAAAVVVAFVLLASGHGHLLAATVLAVGVALLVGDLEHGIVTRRRAGAAFAHRFVELYETGAQRRLSMDEENELWAIASRRLHLCSWERMLAFEHGRRPADDDLLASAYRYLTGSAAAAPADVPAAARRAS